MLIDYFRVPFAIIDKRYTVRSATPNQKAGATVSAETIAPVIVTLAVFAALLAVLKLLKNRGMNFTPRVFIALGLGIALGAGIQLALDLGSEAATTALDWMSLVGQGYISLLKMLVMPLVFVAIVGAFTRTESTKNLGRIGAVVLAVLLGTVAVAALAGWASTAFTGLAGASFTDASVDASKMDSLQTRQDQVSDLTIPQELLSFIPTNIFADLAGTRATSTIAVVVFSAIVGIAYLIAARQRFRPGGVFQAAHRQPVRHRHAHRVDGAGAGPVRRAGAHRQRPWPQATTTPSLTWGNSC